MRKKYKIIIIAVMLLIVSGIGIFYGIKYNSKLLWKEIYINKWNDGYENYLICRANVEGEPWLLYHDGEVVFYSDSEKSDIVDTNRKDYIGEITYNYFSLEHPASLFFSDNNYYALYYEETMGYYVIINCHLLYDMDDMEVFIPSPTRISIGYDYFRTWNDDGNELDFLYDNNTFEDAAEFYGRISDEYVSIDEEMQQITLDGFDVKNNVILEDFLILDFKNRTVIAPKKDGGKRVLDGTETMAPLD